MAHADVIVIGLGAVGAASAWQLAKRGLNVLGIDRWHPPHAFGSSHGETRITREAIGEGDAFVPLVRRSDQIWAELEAGGSGPLSLRCGALIIGAEGGTTEMHGQPGFVAGTVAAAQRFGIAHELLSADETRARFPVFLPVEGDLVYYEPGAGLLFPERCVAAQLEAARAAGARLNMGERVLAHEQLPGGVRVTTDKAIYEAAEAVIAAGAWAPGMAGDALSDASITRQVLHWLRPADPALFRADRCPVFIWAHGPTSDDSFYGFPLLPGAEDRGVKVADEQFTRSFADPELLERRVGAGETDELFKDHLAGRMQGLLPGPLKTAACMYTTLPSARFVLKRLAEAKNVTLVSACSGHGFKHSAAVGERVAEMVTAGGSYCASEAFAR